MAGRRGYNLLCPVARTLDLIGDRWTTLILRDLHAGPAGFNELQHGLGVASNLLSSRLTTMQDNGLIEPADGGGYRLTDLGRATAPILVELAAFGRRLPEPESPREAGNLRTAFLPIRTIFERAPDRPHLTGRIVIDGESFTADLTPDAVALFYNDDSISVDATATTTYSNFMDLAAGRASVDEHLARFEHSGHPDDATALMATYAEGLVAMFGD